MKAPPCPRGTRIKAGRGCRHDGLIGDTIAAVADIRFPRRRIRRRLLDIDQELGEWRAQYLEAIGTTQAEWLQGRFMDREAILAEIQERIYTAAELLEGFPRLK